MKASDSPASQSLLQAKANIWNFSPEPQTSLSSNFYDFISFHRCWFFEKDTKRVISVHPTSASPCESVCISSRQKMCSGEKCCSRNGHRNSSEHFVRCFICHNSTRCRWKLTMVVNNDDLWVTGRSLVLFAPTLSSFQTVRLHKGTTRRGKNELVLKNVVNVIHRSGEIWLCQMVKTSPLKHRRQVKRKSNQNWLSNTLLSLAELGCPHSLSYYPACQSSSIWCADERKRKKNTAWIYLS